MFGSSFASRNEICHHLALPLQRGDLSVVAVLAEELGKKWTRLLCLSFLMWLGYSRIAVQSKILKCIVGACDVLFVALCRCCLDGYFASGACKYKRVFV